MRRDAPRPSRTWHAPSAWRYARVGVPRAPSGRAVRRARAVRCARHGGPRRAMLQHVLRVAVLDAAGRCRAERRCVGRCASPWTGRLGSRCSLLNAANSWPSRLRSTSQTITFVVLESISLSSLRCATGLCVVLAALRDRVVCAWALGGGGCLKLRPSMLYHMPPSDVPALQYHIRHGVM